MASVAAVGDASAGVFSVARCTGVSASGLMNPPAPAPASPAPASSARFTRSAEATGSTADTLGGLIAIELLLPLPLLMLLLPPAPPLLALVMCERREAVGAYVGVEESSCSFETTCRCPGPGTNRASGPTETLVTSETGNTSKPYLRISRKSFRWSRSSVSSSRFVNRLSGTPMPPSTPLPYAVEPDATSAKSSSSESSSRRRRVLRKANAQLKSNA